MNIGKRIQEERKRQNITLEDLAKQVGNISKATLSRIENSEGPKNEPSFNLMVKLSQILGVQLEHFAYGVKSESEMINENFEEIIEHMTIGNDDKRILRSITDWRLKKSILALGPLQKFMMNVKEDRFRVIEVISKKELFMDGSVRQNWKMIMQALTDDLHYYRHRYSRSEKNQYHRYTEFKIVGDIKMDNNEKEGIQPVIIVNSPQFVYFNIPLNSPTKKGQKITLEWTEEYQNGHAMSKSLLGLNNDFEERSAYFVLYNPTDHLRKEIVFPGNVSLSNEDIYPDVEKHILDKRIKNLEEISKIRNNNLFSVKKVKNKLKAILEVSNPKPGSAYYIRWKVPN